MQLSRFRILIYMGLIFSAGIAAGILAERLNSAETVSAKATPTRSNDDWRQRYVESMRTRLRMDEAQMKQLNDTLDETRVEYRVLRQSYRPQMEKIHEGQVAKILKFLRPEQIAEFQKLEREREQKLKARENGPGI
jgi:hypothetical protein